MKKLEAVEEARAAMKQGMEWGVWKWLLEKRRVRKIADRATEALNNAEDAVKATWSDELVEAYNLLIDEEEGVATKSRKRTKGTATAMSEDVLRTAKQMKELDDETERVRLDAEAIFEDAEQRMSTAGARAGAKRALDTYDLHEKAIRKAEAVAKLR